MTPRLWTIGLVAAVVASSAFAETVFVKYRGPVDLAPFRCAWVSRSSVVERVCYDRRNEYLLVSLRGTYYHYCGLQPATHSAWLSAESMGRFYNARIKGNFDCRVTPPPRY